MPAWAAPERHHGAWILRSESGRVLARMPDGALYFEQCYWPFLENYDLDRLPEALGENMWCAVRSPPGPLVAGEDGGRLLADGARNLRQRTDRAVIGLFGGNLLEMGQFLWRNDIDPGHLNRMCPGGTGTQWISIHSSELCWSESGHPGKVQPWLATGGICIL